MSRQSKLALTSLKKADFLVTSIRTQKPTVSPRLAERFRPVGSQSAGEGSATDWDQVQESNAELLEGDARDLREASQVHRTNKMKVFEVRRHRDDVADGLRQRYRAFKTSFDAAYETEALGLVALDAPPERNHGALREQCGDVVVRGRDESLAERLGPHKPGSTPPDLEGVTEDLESEIAVYDAVLDDLRKAEKIRDESYLVKEEARKRLNHTYANVARVQEGYYRLAGLDELAERIRVTIPVRSANPEGSEEPGSEEPGSEEPASPPAQDDAP